MISKEKKNYLDKLELRSFRIKGYNDKGFNLHNNNYIFDLQSGRNFSMLKLNLKATNVPV